MKNEALIERRHSANMTIKDVAFQAGITATGYLYYEQGKRKPSVDIAIRIAHALGVFDFKGFKCLWQFSNC